MQGRLLTLLVILPWIASAALGGAWPRAKGETFLSLSGEISEKDETGLYRQSFGLYAEYGATPRLTLGLDAYGDAVRMSKAIAFLRWPLGDADRATKIALEIGAGQVEEETALRPGLSVGRGFVLWERNGWLNADTRAILRDGAGIAYETELTAGLSVGDRVKAILQVQAGMPDEGQDYVRLAPSVVYALRPGVQVELGILAPVLGGGLNTVKLGVWREF